MSEDRYQAGDTAPIAVAIRKLANAPEDAVVSIDTESREWSYSEYTGGVDIKHTIDVWWDYYKPGGPKKWHREYDSIGEVLADVLSVPSG